VSATDIHHGRDAESHPLSEAYGRSVGAVMLARKQYDDVCAAQGADSESARQAHDILTRAIEHRNEMRDSYDAAIGRPPDRS
jgi:hypothetical protein